MAITFDAATSRIILDSTSVTASEIWSRWVDWQATGDNSKYPVAFTQVGGDDLGSGLFIPVYMFLQNGWRVRPMEANHTLIITGNLFVQGGGVPLVQTLGAFNVSAQYTVPVQAQGISTSGGGGATADDVWAHASAVDLIAKMAVAHAILRNKTVTDPSTGAMTVYDTDGTTPLYTATLYEGVTTAQPYRGQGAERRERLT